MSVKTEDRLLANIAAAATIAGGVLHLMMIGPFLKTSNFPMELLLYTDILFIVAGLAQIFLALPMIKGWGVRWYYLFQNLSLWTPYRIIGNRVILCASCCENDRSLHRQKSMV